MTFQYLQTKEYTCRAESIVNKIRKPTVVEKKALAACFPSSSQPPKRSLTFDPTADCVAEPQKKKKKASQPKPVNVNVILLKRMQKYIPRGGARKKLQSQGRIMKVALNRNLSAQQVKNAILKAFKGIKGLKEFTTLECTKSNRLQLSSVHELTGELAVERRGALYLCM